ncbi:hypothetical protein BGZ76_006051, partial [Entomortierella beljakovae]
MTTSTENSQENEQVSAKMRIHISRGRDLAPKDKSGKSDPYAKISIGGQCFTTKVVKKNLNPIWNESFDFVIEPQSMPDIVKLVLWDKDLISSDDFMG